MKKFAQFMNHANAGIAAFHATNAYLFLREQSLGMAAFVFLAAFGHYWLHLWFAEKQWELE